MLEGSFYSTPSPTLLFVDLLLKVLCDDLEEWGGGMGGRFNRKGIFVYIWHSTPVLLPGESQGWGSLVGCSPWGREELDTTERLHFHFLLSCIGEGNGNPFQCSCLENPSDGGAWSAAVSGVAQSRTQLKWLSSSSSWFQGGAVVKNLPANSGDPKDTGLIPGLGSPGVENDNPLQYSLLENLMDRGAWCATIYGFPTSMGSQRVGDDWAHAHSWFISLLCRN